MRKPYMMRTAAIALVTTALQMLFLWLNDTATWLWGITIVGQVAVWVFAWFQFRPNQALPVWFFELRNRYIGAAIPYTVWALLTWRGLGIISMLPLTVGLIRFARYLRTYRDELQLEPNPTQARLAVWPMYVYAVVLAATWTGSLIILIS